LKRRGPSQVSRTRSPARIAGAALLLALAAAAVFLATRRGPAPLPRFSNPRQLTTSVGIEDFAVWSPDGQVIAYAASASGGTYGGSWDIWLTQLDAEAPVNRTADYPGEDRFPGWSPNGRQIAFWSDREGGAYFVMPALGGHATRASHSMTAGVDSPRSRDWIGATRPQWSADGSRLIFSGFTPADGSFLEMVTLATSESRRLALPGRTDGRRFDLSWSPDEQWLAYVDASGPTAQVSRLWVLRLEDGVAAPITDGLTNDWSPSWSADGSSLYFVSNRGGSMDLWRQPLDADGRPDGPGVQLTTGLEMKQAAFSPDGSKLAYSRGRRIANLWRVPILAERRATWADAEQLTFDRTMVEHVDVSPDGQRLVVSWDRSGQPDLWTLPAAGGEPRRLTTTPTPDWAPAWSPDGRQIVFYAFFSGNRDIWVMPAQGGPPRQLTTHDATDWYPAWSPDGRRLAIWSERSGNSDVWVMSAAGSEPRQLTFHQADDVHPDWWPDARSVVFASNRTGDDRLWRVQVDGERAEPEQLTRGAGRLGRVAPDGEHVYFIGRTDRTDNIWALGMSDRSEAPVTALTGRQGTIGPNALATDGRYLYFTWQEDESDIWVTDVTGLAN
jgi:TolB protein